MPYQNERDDRGFWSELLHPRHPKGSAKGGKFAKKDEIQDVGGVLEAFGAGGPAPWKWPKKKKPAPQAVPAVGDDVVIHSFDHRDVWGKKGTIVKAKPGSGNEPRFDVWVEGDVLHDLAPGEIEPMAPEPERKPTFTPEELPPDRDVPPALKPGWKTPRDMELPPDRDVPPRKKASELPEVGDQVRITVEPPPTGLRWHIDGPVKGMVGEVVGVNAGNVWSGGEPRLDVDVGDGNVLFDLEPSLVEVVAKPPPKKKKKDGGSLGFHVPKAIQGAYTPGPRFDLTDEDIMLGQPRVRPRGSLTDAEVAEARKKRLVAKLEEPKKKVAEDDPNWDWTKDGNGERGVTLKDGTKKVVNAKQFEQLAKAGKLDPKKTPQLKGDPVRPDGKPATAKRPAKGEEPKKSGSSGWDPSKHPRADAGAPTGGQFVSVGSGSQSEKGATAAAASKLLGSKLTTAAIKQFQKQHGLEVDGIIGHQTAQALLGKKDAKSAQVAPMSDADVKALKQMSKTALKQRLETPKKEPSKGGVAKKGTGSTGGSAAPAKKGKGGRMYPTDTEESRAVVSTSWDGSASRFSDEEWERSCVLDRGGDLPPKSRCSLPVREPNGDLNRNAVHAAAGALAGARGGVKAPPDAKKAAARKLVAIYRQLDEEPPFGLKNAAGRMRPEDYAAVRISRQPEPVEDDPDEPADDPALDDDEEVIIAKPARRDVTDAVLDVEVRRALDRFEQRCGRFGEIEHRYLPFDHAAVEVKNSGDGTETSYVIRGHAAVFGHKSLDLGGFEEYVDPRAFDRVLGKDQNIVLLWDHDSKRHLASTKTGRLKLEVTKRGLRYSANVLGNTSYARDLRALMEAGEVDQSSFSFTVADDSWEVRTDRDGNERVIRTINEVSDLFDVTVTAAGAYPDTDAEIIRHAAVKYALDTGRIDPASEGAERRSAEGTVAPVEPGDAHADDDDAPVEPGVVAEADEDAPVEPGVDEGTTFDDDEADASDEPDEHRSAAYNEHGKNPVLRAARLRSHQATEFQRHLLKEE